MDQLSAAPNTKAKYAVFRCDSCYSNKTLQEFVKKSHEQFDLFSKLFHTIMASIEFENLIHSGEQS